MENRIIQKIGTKSGVTENRDRFGTRQVKGAG
jgi:hypothetical protein